MSYVIAAPEMMTSAASDLAAIGSTVNAAHMVAAARTTSVIPAAADEVSTGIAALFSQHAANYQALASRAAAFNDQFVHNLTAGAFSYASTDAAAAQFLQDITEAFLGSPFVRSIAVVIGLITELFTAAPGFITASFAANPLLTILGVAGFLLALPLIIPLALLAAGGFILYNLVLSFIPE